MAVISPDQVDLLCAWLIEARQEIREMGKGAGVALVDSGLRKRPDLEWYLGFMMRVLSLSSGNTHQEPEIEKPPRHQAVIISVGDFVSEPWSRTSSGITARAPMSSSKDRLLGFVNTGESALDAKFLLSRKIAQSQPSSL